MSFAKLMELLVILGPKFKEALPYIIAIIKLFSDAANKGTPVSYSIPADGPSKEHADFVRAAVGNGSDPDQATELANLVSAGEQLKTVA